MTAITLLPSLQQKSRIRFKNILLATDLTEASTEAQAYALLLARNLGAHLFVLHVEPAPESPESTKKKTAESEVGKLAEFLRASGVGFTLMIERGEFHSTLNKAAEEQSIDLII